MININEITLLNDLEELYGVQYGIEYKNNIFIFESIEDRQMWLDTSSTEDLDNIIYEQEEIKEA